MVVVVKRKIERYSRMEARGTQELSEDNANSAKAKEESGCVVDTLARRHWRLVCAKISQCEIVSEQR